MFVVRKVKQQVRNSGKGEIEQCLRKFLEMTSVCAVTCVFVPKSAVLLNVFRSNSNIHAQIIDDVNGVTLASASSVELKLENGGNVEAAKTVGTEIAKRAIEKNITGVVFDRGGYVYTGRVKALAEAARVAGLKF